MKLSSKVYVSITPLGEERTITDVFSIIESKGERRFLMEYGYSHNIKTKSSSTYMPYLDSVPVFPYISLGYFNKGYYYWDGNGLFQCDHIYEIFDGLGNKVNPADLVKEYKKTAKYRKKERTRVNNFYFRGGKKGTKGYRCFDIGKNYPIEKASLGVVHEDGEPPIRPKSYKRSSEHAQIIITPANWKNQRKTQYK